MTEDNTENTTSTAEGQSDSTGLVMCGYWYCPTCKEEVDSSRVTFSEHHDSCDTPVVWVEPGHTVVRRDLLDALQKMAEEWEKEGGFLDNPHDDPVDRQAGRIYKMCARELRKQLAT